jgi:hypothetical protein
MAEDFRTLLKETFRNDETGERWFDDLVIGKAFFLSIQASTLHASTPPVLLDDISAYTAFQVTLQLKRGVFTCGRRGAWDWLREKSWWDSLVDESPLMRVGENISPQMIQAIYEDVVQVALEHPEIVSKKCQHYDEA